tara:strand:+ start:546 stop:911 length:366 start_codon:yes stop_codon:yes gene_type:complete
MAQETITPEARPLLLLSLTDPVNPVVLDTVVQMYHECTMDCDSPNVDDLLNQFSDTIETLLGIRGHDLVNPTYVPRYLIDANLERLVIMCPNTNIVMHQICYHWDCECADCMNPQQYASHL